MKSQSWIRKLGAAKQHECFSFFFYIISSIFELDFFHEIADGKKRKLPIGGEKFDLKLSSVARFANFAPTTFHP